jgi:hypothetical protein
MVTVEACALKTIGAGQEQGRFVSTETTHSIEVTIHLKIKYEFWFI